MRFTSPRATHHAHWSMTVRASASPSRAAAWTCSPRTASGSSPASATTASSRPAVAASRASRARPEPEAKRSQQPRRPHTHGGPLGSTTMWPGSPAKPLAPRTRRPSITMPAADAGAEGDERDVGRRRRRRRGATRQRGAGGVVVDVRPGGRAARRAACRWRGRGCRPRWAPPATCPSRRHEAGGPTPERVERGEARRPGRRARRAARRRPAASPSAPPGRTVAVRRRSPRRGTSCRRCRCPAAARHLRTAAGRRCARARRGRRCRRAGRRGSSGRAALSMASSTTSSTWRIRRRTTGTPADGGEPAARVAAPALGGEAARDQQPVDPPFAHGPQRGGQPADATGRRPMALAQPVRRGRPRRAARSCPRPGRTTWRAGRRWCRSAAGCAPPAAPAGTGAVPARDPRARRASARRSRDGRRRRCVRASKASWAALLMCWRACCWRWLSTRVLRARPASSSPWRSRGSTTSRRSTTSPSS